MAVTEVQMKARGALALIFFIMLMDVVGIRFYIQSHPTSCSATAAQFFAVPAMGKLGDGHGRWPALLVSLFGSAIDYVIFGIDGALWVLFLFAGWIIIE